MRNITLYSVYSNQGQIFFTVKYEAKISNLQLELKSVKSQSDNTLARLTQIENRFDNRLNQIENRFAHLEGHHKDDVYSYEDYDTN